MIDERKQTIRVLKNSIKVHQDRLTDPELKEERRETIEIIVDLKNRLDYARRNKYSSKYYQFIPNTKPNRKQRRTKYKL